MVLNPVISKLTNKLVVLASASPRRQDILRNAGLKFEVVPSWFKETLDKGLFKAPHEYAVETAKQKALEVARRMPLKHLKTPDMVIGADTIVTVDGLILEKPVDKHDAYRMLSRLSGKEHSVYTGVAIILCHGKEDDEVDYQLMDFYEETKVKFAELSESMLWEYINSGEPMDKAGGYGIQALGGMLVEYVHGDFLNVVGFPLNRFCKQLDLIYNRSTSSSDRESPRANENSHSCSSAAKHSPPSSSSKHTHQHKKSPSASPLHKVKRTSCDAAGGESSPSSSSNHTDVCDTTLPPMTSRGRPSGQEDGEPRKEDLKKIMNLMDGFKASKALFTASKLGVFDLLQSKPGLDAEQVAQEVKASAKGTVCLLEACVSLGLLQSRGESFQKPVYENTDLSSRFLLSDAPLSLHGYIQHCDRTVWPLFSHLESAVTEGSSQHDKAFGKKSKDMFQDTVYYNQEVKLRFMSAMHSIAKVTGRDIATAFDLSSFKSACDLGGCTGAMAYEFTKAHPELSVTVFDLPAVVGMTEHFVPPHRDDRVTFVAGDFFEDELPKADLYILARILHDWSDERVSALLKRISDVCKPGCGVLIAETSLDGRRAHAALQSLNMLVQTEGRERTESEYVDLLSRHGFGDTRLVHTGNFLDAFLSVKM